MSQGHWRKLPAGHVGEGRFGEETPGRTWVDTKYTARARAAKGEGKVPSPMPVGTKDGFVAFAVPGGNFMFVVHESLAKTFAEITSKGNWTDSKEFKGFITKAEKKGLFGIFKHDKPILGYDQ